MEDSLGSFVVTGYSVLFCSTLSLLFCGGLPVCPVPNCLIRRTLRTELQLDGARFSLLSLVATSVKGENREDTVAVQRAPRQILVAVDENVLFIIAITRTAEIELEKRRSTNPSKAAA